MSNLSTFISIIVGLITIAGGAIALVHRQASYGSDGVRHNPFQTLANHARRDRVPFRPPTTKRRGGER